MSAWQRVRAMFGASAMLSPDRRPEQTEMHPRAAAALAKASAALEKRRRIDRLDAEVARVEAIIAERNQR